jgi:uncharacterized protein YpuA (DUF1002 family)
MKTKIETKEVEKIVKVKEKVYVVELTHDELVIITASMGTMSHDDIKQSIAGTNYYRLEQELKPETGWDIFNSLKNLLLSK